MLERWQRVVGGMTRVWDTSPDGEKTRTKSSAPARVKICEDALAEAQAREDAAKLEHLRTASELTKARDARVKAERNLALARQDLS